MSTDVVCYKKNLPFHRIPTQSSSSGMLQLLYKAFRKYLELKQANDDKDEADSERSDVFARRC
jgi:hypothetical protein